MDPEHCLLWLTKIDSTYGGEGRTLSIVLHIKRIFQPTEKGSRVIQFETAEYGNKIRFCYMPEKDPVGRESLLLMNRIKIRYWQNRQLDREKLVYVKSIETYQKRDSLRKRVYNYLF